MSFANFFSEHVVNGRKAHRCNACRQEIPIATRHVSISACTEGRHWASRYHLECRAETAGALDLHARQVLEQGAAAGFSGADVSELAAASQVITQRKVVAW